MYILDSENAISNASFVQVPPYHLARRQMNYVFYSFGLESIVVILRYTVTPLGR